MKLRLRTAASALFATVCLSLAALPSVAATDARWFESGDAGLRMDLQLLNDAEVIRLPVTQWPLPRAAVAYAMSNAKQHFATNAAVSAALARVQQRLQDQRRLGLRVAASAGQAGLLRDFDDLAREDAELSARGDYASGRVAVSLNLSGVADPVDDESLRADGSHATISMGNWLVSANTLERFWGPSHISSLILSNNARPMPTFMVERAEARPFENVLLSWLGPWRFNFAVSQMEGNRADIDSPLFMAARVVVMPFKKMEIGISRTAQFCGDQLECSLEVFGNLLIGNDNVGIDATPENEPGNQMAGFDMRWNSPIGNLPYAIYGQYIGEDESSYLPAKYLNQLGLEVWKPLGSGAMIQTFAEYSSTTCSANTSRGPYYNCAYTQGRFNVEGYRYRGRVIGYTSDNDAETYAAGASYQSPGGELWSVTARNALLNRDGIDTRNTVSAGPAKYNSLELGWRGRVFGETVAVELGAESLEPRGGERDVEPFGFVRWTHEFAP